MFNLSMSLSCLHFFPFKVVHVVVKVILRNIKHVIKLCLKDDLQDCTWSVLSLPLTSPLFTFLPPSDLTGHLTGPQKHQKRSCLSKVF